MIAKSATKTPSSEGRSSETDTLLVGLDWGTNTSCLMAAPKGSSESKVTFKEQIPTVVGYAAESVLHRVLPNEAKVLFGTEALKHKLYLDLVRPLKGGVIGDVASARDFAQHLRDRLGAGDREVRAVIGMPASSDMSAREDARAAVQGVFHKVLFVPEPFLAALGYRDESRLADTKYQDPVMNSLYIDIGAGSTDVCLVQGHYPTVEDQLSVPFAGDAVDQIILDGILAAYPDCGLNLARVREIKEKHSFVLAGDSSQPAIATVMVGGKARKLDVTEQVGAGCEALLQKVFELSRELIARADPDSVSDLLQNIIVTGGGSQIKGIDTLLQKRLADDGFEAPKVKLAGQDYQRYVAMGALKAARAARENQWQVLLG